MRCRALAVALLAATAALAAACRPAPEPTSPPVVWITVRGLRADAVGFLGGPPRLTPNLDRLAATATWAGSAVAASSDTAPALASLLTGLRPWQHQVLHPGSPPPAGELLTVAEALSRRGYSTTAFLESRGLRAGGAWTQGIERLHPLGGLDRPAERLERLERGEFVWIQLDRPSPPYRLRHRFLERLPRAPRRLPARVRWRDLAPYFDPSRPLPDAERERFWALYCLDVAAVDAQLGVLLDALRRSPRFAEALVVVVAEHGQEFGEHGGVGFGGSLGRELIEVPLVIKLPRGAASAALAIAPGERPAATRLWATVVEQAGGSPPPATAPSLLRRAPAGAPSELYLDGGANEFSWVEGDLQLRRTVRFADPQDLFASLPDRAAAARRRVEGAFLASLPWSAPAQRVALRLERWGAQRGSEPLADAGAARRLERALDDAWHLFLDEERTPAREAAAR